MKSLNRWSSLLSVCVLTTGGLLGCTGTADEGIPTASWISVIHDDTCAVRPATVQGEKDRPGISADDVVSSSVASEVYDRYSARGNEPGTKVAPPRKPYEPPAVSPSEKPQERSPNATTPERDLPNPYSPNPSATPSGAPSVPATAPTSMVPATLYPTQAQAAAGAGSVSLYPPAGLAFNPNFARTPTFYPPASPMSVVRR